MSKIKILVIPGSLREKSSSNQVIHVLRTMVPDHVEFTIYEDLAKIPAFDDSNTTPDSVANFRKLIQEADGVLVCTPEYAFGVPGALKNALDWTVGSGELTNKPTALVTASTGGEHGHAALLLIFKAISTNVVEGGTLLISFIRSKLTERGEIKDPAITESLKSVLQALVAEASIKNKELV